PMSVPAPVARMPSFFSTRHGVVDDHAVARGVERELSLGLSTVVPSEEAVSISLECVTDGRQPHAPIAGKGVEANERAPSVRGWRDMVKGESVTV
ncbi:MAG: hypothetical protein AAFQ11_11230, partial [Pseudomonadota bacterium]